MEATTSTKTNGQVADPGASEPKVAAPVSKPLDGKVEVGDGTGLVADLLTHALVDEGAKEIVRDIGDRLGGCARILLVSDRALALDDWPYHSVRTSLDAFAAAFATAMANLNESVGTIPRGDEDMVVLEERGPRRSTLFLSTAASALAGVSKIVGASSLIGSAADVAGWIRADYSIKNRAVSVGDTALLGALAGHLLRKSHKVDVDGFGLLEGSALLADFSEAVASRNALAALSAQVKAQTVEPTKRESEIATAALKEAATALTTALASQSDAGQQELSEREDELRRELANLDSSGAWALAAVGSADTIVKAFDELVTVLTTTPSKEESYPPLLAAAIRERLHSKEGGYTHVLYAGLESVAGETIAKRSLWTGPKLRYVGGGQLTFLLLKVSDNTVAAGGTQSLLGTTKMSLWRGSTGAVSRIRFYKQAQWGLKTVRRRRAT